MRHVWGQLEGNYPKVMQSRYTTKNRVTGNHPKTGNLLLEAQTEVDGIGMGVLSDGTQYLSQRGLAALSLQRRVWRERRFARHKTSPDRVAGLAGQHGGCRIHPDQTDICLRGFLFLTRNALDCICRDTSRRCSGTGSQRVSVLSAPGYLDDRYCR